MTNAFDPRVTVEVGTLRRTLGLVEFAEALGVPTLRSDLLRLVAESPATSAVHNVFHKGGGRGRDNGSENASVSLLSEGELLNSFSPDVLGKGVVEGEEGCRGEEGGEGEDAFAFAAMHVADHLARSLGDAHSLRFHQLLAEHVALADLRTALAAALELGPHEIRRSRAAYFTAIMLPQLRKSRRASRRSPRRSS